MVVLNGSKWTQAKIIVCLPGSCEQKLKLASKNWQWVYSYSRRPWTCSGGKIKRSFSALCCSVEVVPLLVLGKLQPALGSRRPRSNWPHLPQSTATGSGSFPSLLTCRMIEKEEERGAFLLSVCIKRMSLRLKERRDWTCPRKFTITMTLFKGGYSHVVAFVAIKEIIFCFCEGGQFYLTVKSTCEQQQS